MLQADLARAQTQRPGPKYSSGSPEGVTDTLNAHLKMQHSKIVRDIPSHQPGVSGMVLRACEEYSLAELNELARFLLRPLVQPPS